MTSNEYHMFIYDMPYATRRTLCSIMDSNNKYEELGKSMQPIEWSIFARARISACDNNPQMCVH